jgi:K+-transporting ATPase ATPase C chain
MKILKQAFGLFLILTIVTGIIYPTVIAALGTAIFPKQAAGSMLSHDGRAIGSALIGQKFTADSYFWPRPSAIDYNPLPSGGSNQGMTSAILDSAVRDRQRLLIESNPGSELVPADLLYASGSGLDPHISPGAARFQIDRVARARGLDNGGKLRLIELVEKLIEQPDLGIFGEPRINVLKLNLALDSAFVNARQ